MEERVFIAEQPKPAKESLQNAFGESYRYFKDHFPQKDPVEEMEHTVLSFLPKNFSMVTFPSPQLLKMVPHFLSLIPLTIPIKKPSSSSKNEGYS